MVGKRNHRGFGYLRRTSAKRWHASYQGPDLARHNAPRTFEAKGDAEAWLASERALISAGAWSPPKFRASAGGKAVSFESYARTWLRDRRLKPKTREGYDHLLNRYLIPEFGNVALSTISPAMVRAWWGSLEEDTPTINARAYSLLKAIMNTAVADEEMVANPCRIRSATSVPRAREIRPATLEELGIIVEAMPDNRRAAVLLCSWCAMRIGEVLELRRKDLDLKRGVVTIERSVAWVAGRPVVGSPKSAAGRRSVTVPPHVLPALQHHLDEFVSRGRESLLFPARDGVSHLQPSVFHDAFRKARAAAGRGDLRVHDLRHTGATMAAMAGATLAELQQRLGHSSVGAALRYQHAAQGRDAAIAQALSRLATGEKPGSS